MCVHVCLPCSPFSALPAFVWHPPPPRRLFAHVSPVANKFRPFSGHRRRYSAAAGASLFPHAGSLWGAWAPCPAPASHARLDFDLLCAGTRRVLRFVFYLLLRSAAKTPGIHLPRLDEGRGLPRRARRRPSPEHQGLPGNGGSFRIQGAPGTYGRTRRFLPPPSLEIECALPSVARAALIQSGVETACFA